MEAVVEKLRSALPGNLPFNAVEGTTALIEESCPLAFWGQLIGTLDSGNRTALMNPAWPVGWKKRLASLATAESVHSNPCLLVATSGSTGIPKFCIHTLDTLWHAATGFRAALAANPVPHCLNVLPQHHIGSLMPVFRSACCGGKVHFADYRDAKEIGRAPFALEQASISLVPTQLQRMMEHPKLLDLLSRLPLILVGGAASPPGLLEQARAAGLNLAPCYGSTETAAMVTLLYPKAFLEGAQGVGSALPHANVRILEDGRIVVESSALFKGYLPEPEEEKRHWYAMGDIGEFDSRGNLRILGRADRVIITGGENVHPELVETTAMDSGLVNSAICRGIEDRHWGNRIELWVDPVGNGPDVVPQLAVYLRETLPPFARPKKIHLVRE